MEPKRVFFNPADKPVNIECPEKQFGLDRTQIVFELFRIKTGRQGYYLADLKHQKYYYCGLEFDTVKLTLKSLGIGRDDPMENLH